ncbi:MAG: hypothetical protein Q7S37_03815 [bacterium]|nr:hypothetical protein [bacterium]
MKIPITYLILAVVVLLTISATRQNFIKINKEAESLAQIQQSKDIQLYAEHVKTLNDASFITKRGIGFLKKGQIELACAALEQGAKLDSNYRDASFYLGYAYLKELQNRQKELSLNERQDLLAKAKKALMKAQSIDPLYPMTNKLLAIISDSQNNDKEKRLWYARYDTVTGKKVDIDLISVK